MLSTLNQTRPDLRIALGLALLYWLDVLLLSLPGAAAHTPDYLVPLMIVAGLPVLFFAAKLTLREPR